MRCFLALGLLSVLTSCSIQAHLTLKANRPSILETDVKIRPEGMGVWDSLRSIDATLPEHPFDARALTASLGREAQVVSEPGHVHVIAPVGTEGWVLPGLVLTDSTWNATLDRPFLRSLVQRTAWGKSPAVDTLLPGPDVTVTEQDDTDLLVYLLGSQVDEAVARKLIAESVLEFTITVPRPILKAPGATTVQGRSATYRWPLVRLLSLNPPLVISGQY